MDPLVALAIKLPPHGSRVRLTARHAPGRPELQIDCLLAIELAEINALPIDGLEHELRSQRAEQPASRAFGELLTACVGGTRDRHCSDPEQRNRSYRCDAFHGCAFEGTGRDTGAPFSLTMNTRMRAGFIGLALADTE